MLPVTVLPDGACSGPPPLEYLAVAGLDADVSSAELAGRRACLLAAIGAADPDEPGTLAAALALAAVIAEQHARATGYARWTDGHYGCGCGFSCQGLAAFDEHLDRHAGQNSRHCEAGRAQPSR